MCIILPGTCSIRTHGGPYLCMYVRVRDGPNQPLHRDPQLSKGEELLFQYIIPNPFDDRHQRTEQKQSTRYSQTLRPKNVHSNRDKKCFLYLHLKI
jgi:hypothetical protein